MAKAASPDRSALEKIAAWAKAEPGVTIGDDGTITVGGDHPIDLTVTADEDRVQLTHHHVERTDDFTRIDAVRRSLPGRGSAVTGAVAAAADSLEVTLTSTVYIDGLTRQGFITAFNELIAAVDRAIGSAPAFPPPSPAVAVPVMPIAAVTTPIDGDTAESAPAAQPATAVTDSSPTMVLSQVWVPTHRVPDGGLRAWPKPDPAVEAIASLQPRVELSIAERRGDWARVIGSNSWTGWVDARRLQQLTAGRTAAPATRGIGFPLGAVGAVALAGAAFLPWFSFGGPDVNAFDVAVKFLWDLDGTGDPMLGIVVVALGALGLVAALVPAVPDAVRRVAGFAGIGVSSLFAFQVHRGLDTTFGDTFDALGYGVFIALAAAIVLLVSPRGKITAS